MFRSHSVAVAQTSQTLWSCLGAARQIKISNLSHLSAQSHKVSLLLSDGGLKTPHITFFINIQIS